MLITNKKVRLREHECAGNQCGLSPKFTMLMGSFVSNGLFIVQVVRTVQLGLSTDQLLLSVALAQLVVEEKIHVSYI